MVRLIKSLIFLCVILLFPNLGLLGQDVQFWMDAYGYKNIGKDWEYEANIGYNTVARDSAWHDVYFSNTFTWQIKKWYALEGSAEIDFSKDPSESNIIELNIQGNQTFTFVQFIDAIHLAKPYLTAKLEFRFLWYPGVDTSDFKYRTRFRIGGKFILNKTRIEKNAVYVPFYYENFFELNGAATERKAEKARGKVGLGYVFSTKVKGELGYIAQLARNTIDNDIERTDFVLQFKLRYYFDK